MISLLVGYMYSIYYFHSLVNGGWGGIARYMPSAASVTGGVHLGERHKGKETILRKGFFPFAIPIIL